MSGPKLPAAPRGNRPKALQRLPLPAIEVNDNPLSLSLWRRHTMPPRGWHCTEIKLPERGQTFTESCAWCANPIGDEAHTVEHDGTTAKLVVCRACQVALLGPECRSDHVATVGPDTRGETMEDLRYASTDKAKRSLSRTDLKARENWTQVGDMSFRYMPPDHDPDDFHAVVWQDEDDQWRWNLYLPDGSERDGGPHYNVVNAAEDMMREHLHWQSA